MESSNSAITTTPNGLGIYSIVGQNSAGNSSIDQQNSNHNRDLENQHHQEMIRYSQQWADESWRSVPGSDPNSSLTRAHTPSGGYTSHWLNDQRHNPTMQNEISHQNNSHQEIEEANNTNQNNHFGDSLVRYAQPNNTRIAYTGAPRYLPGHHHGYFQQQELAASYYHNHPTTPMRDSFVGYSSIPVQCAATCGGTTAQFTPYLPPLSYNQHTFYSFPTPHHQYRQHEHSHHPNSSVTAQSLQEYALLSRNANLSSGINETKKKNRKTINTIPLRPNENAHSNHNEFHQFIQTNSNISQQQQRKGDPLKCSNCGVRETPAWRRDLQGIALLCNSCGLYLKNKGVHRPTERAPDGTIRLKRATKSETELSCSNCHTKTTPCWRGTQNHKLCNKCGLFQKTHGYPRPSSPELRARRGMAASNLAMIIGNRPPLTPPQATSIVPITQNPLYSMENSTSTSAAEIEIHPSKDIGNKELRDF
ncbi:hypothetical protein G9A89_001378 [Geosiphon pyriformis]|nr:hypothetical protein G9A89_001378 [Geosiphon pyriformis]